MTNVLSCKHVPRKQFILLLFVIINANMQGSQLVHELNGK